MAGAEAWLAAEAAAAGPLAGAAAALARLDEATRRGPPGFTLRLAILEATALLRADGAAARIERVALLRAGAAIAPAEAEEGAARAAWAAGRLAAPAATPHASEDVFALLERARPNAEPPLAALTTRPTGAASEAAAEAWDETHAGLAGAHPLTRAAAGFAGWRALAAPGEIAEPGLLAARIAAEGARAAPFAPLALAAGRGLGRVRVADDLPLFLEAAREGAAAALAQLERLETWTASASAGATGAVARRRSALAAHLAATPATSASLAARALGVSTRTAERLLASAEAEGLVRELTGQARWRFWTARA